MKINKLSFVCRISLKATCFKLLVDKHAVDILLLNFLFFSLRLDITIVKFIRACLKNFNRKNCAIISLILYEIVKKLHVFFYYADLYMRIRVSNAPDLFDCGSNIFITVSIYL